MATKINSTQTSISIDWILCGAGFALGARCLSVGRVGKAATGRAGLLAPPLCPLACTASLRLSKCFIIFGSILGVCYFGENRQFCSCLALPSQANSLRPPTDFIIYYLQYVTCICALAAESIGSVLVNMCVDTECMCGTSPAPAIQKACRTYIFVRWEKSGTETNTSGYFSKKTKTKKPHSLFVTSKTTTIQSSTLRRVEKHFRLEQCARLKWTLWYGTTVIKKCVFYFTLMVLLKSPWVLLTSGRNQRTGSLGSWHRSVQHYVFNFL